MNPVPLPILLTLAGLLLQGPPPKFFAKLYAAHDAIRPGGQTEIAVEIEVSSPWHIYHPIILDTGFATTVAWELPAGVSVGPLRLPPPGLKKAFDLEYLGYAGRIIGLTRLQVAPDAQLGDALEVRATVNALACIEQCLPVSATAVLKLSVATGGEPKPANEKLFQEVRSRLAPLLAEAPYLKGSGVEASKTKLRLDEPGELLLTLRVQPGHHVQDRDPGVEGLIPTRLFIEKIRGIEFGQPVWPEPHVRNMPGFGRVRELSGDVKVRVPLKIKEPMFPPGLVPLRALVQYQACTDAGQCFAPQMAEAFVRLEADTPNPPTTGAQSLPEPSAPTASDPSAGEATVVPPATPPPTLADRAPAGESLGLPTLTAEDWARDIPWQPWRLGLAEELAQRGHTVYVDFTADWCLTCQANKKLVLETEPVRTKMRDLGVIPLIGDFTNQDPVMRAEIRRYGHPTVPLNLVYKAGRPDIVGILPVVLTQDSVLRALEHPEQFLQGGDDYGLLLAMLLGLLGGLILNVMPCVLPVISIKILSFVQQGGEDPGRVLRLGLAFCAGILVWFWAFAAVSSAGNVPWQHPQVIIALAAIVFVLALNLFGVFELTLPGAAAGKLDELASRQGYTGAFLKGLLATLLGTACTAPFLAGAMAWALTQPAWIVFLVFTSAGVGMAAPYLVLAARPQWLKYVPRPGPWMITFKQATSFVLLATVVWLLWILAGQLDARGVVWTVAFLGFLGLAAWMVGKIRPTWEPPRRAAVWLASLAVAGFGLYFCYFWMYDWNHRAAAATPAGSPGPTPQLVRKDQP